MCVCVFACVRARVCECVMLQRAGLCGLCCNVAVRGAETGPAVATAHAWLLLDSMPDKKIKKEAEEIVPWTSERKMVMRTMPDGMSIKMELTLML